MFGEIRTKVMMNDCTDLETRPILPRTVVWGVERMGIGVTVLLARGRLCKWKGDSAKPINGLS